MFQWLKNHVRVDGMLHFNWWVFLCAVGMVPFNWEDGVKSYYVDIDILCFRISLLIDLGDADDES